MRSLLFGQCKGQILVAEKLALTGFALVLLLSAPKRVTGGAFTVDVLISAEAKWTV